MLNQFKQHYIRYVLGVILLATFLANASGWLHLSFVQSLENQSYDARLNWLMPKDVDPTVVIVDIDEKSLSQQGRWPWSRNVLARMVNNLFDYYQIDTLGFDVVFAENDNSAGYQTLAKLKDTHFKNNLAYAQTLASIQHELDYDQQFADSLKNRKVVLGYYFSNQPQEHNGMLPNVSLDETQFKNKPVQFNQHIGYGANLAILQQAAKAGGHFNPEIDTDGITRKISMLTEYDGHYYPSLSLAVTKTALGVNDIKAGYAKKGVGKRYAGLEWLKLGDHLIPVDVNVSSLIPYRGPQGSFKYISASDVIQQKVPKAHLQNKIVLFGTTAPGLMDLRATPVQNIYAGVETHANMITGILNNTIKHRPAYTLGAEFMMLLILGLLIIFYMPMLNPIKATGLAIGLLTITLVFNLGAWQVGHLVLPLASPLLLIALLYILNMSYGYFVESKSKRQLSQLFGQYVPPALVDEMVDSPEALNLTGQSKELTVLFSDVRGFTTLSETIPPERLTALMNALLTPLTQTIHEHKGTIDKYMGDAIMAFWGAPLANAHHAQHAIAAALSMQAKLGEINQQFAAKNWPKIEMGIGLSTGLMTVGNMGSNFRMAYTVMGDAVNLGARLESLTKEYGVPIIVSEQTKKQAPQYLYRELDTVTVKGKTKAVRIYEPICLLDEASKELKDELVLHHMALKHYYDGNDDLAQLQWMNLFSRSGQNKKYEYYLKK